MMSAGACRPWTLRVRSVVAPGETVCVTGSVQQLGSWCPDSVVELRHTSGSSSSCQDGFSEQKQNGSATAADQEQEDATTGGVWEVSVPLPIADDVHYRYCICVIVHMEGQRRVVVRRWETDLLPRTITRAELQMCAAGGGCQGSVIEQSFGYITPVRHVDQGWLHTETVVQLKLHNNPIQIWKKRLDKFRVKVTAVNLDKRLNQLESLLNTASEESSEVEFHASRKGPGWPIIEISAICDDETAFRRQEQFGRRYDTDLFLVFQCQTFKPETTGYMVDFYTDAETECGLAEHIGFAHILPNNITQTTGHITLPVISTRQRPIGQLTVDYLLVRPLTDYTCTMERSFARYWPATWRGLDVGHRGAGSSFTSNSSVCADIRENTLASMKRAIVHGADFVEFDIQLARDMTPIIYHDFHVSIALKKRNVIHDHHLLTVPLKELDVEHLQKLHVYHVEEGHMGSLHLEDDQQDDSLPFPTLKSALETLDPHVGFNIEIKWTMQLKDGSFELYHPFELNIYLDRILRVVLEHSGTRKIIFSCFHPDVCTMLRLKQNMFPVLFLTQGETTLWPPYLDSRTQTLDMAVRFALSAEILGVNVFSRLLLERPDFIGAAKALGLVVFCWGDDNASVDTIRFLKAHHCDGIIYDRMDRYCTKETKESIFLLEERQARDLQLALGACEGSSSDKSSDVGSPVGGVTVKSAVEAAEETAAAEGVMNVG